MKEMLSNRVYDLRTAAGKTQEELAEAVEVTRQTIIALEKGNYSPSVQLALKISHFFNKCVDEVFYISHGK